MEVNNGRRCWWPWTYLNILVPDVTAPIQKEALYTKYACRDTGDVCCTVAQLN